MEHQIVNNFADAIQAIKSAILKSRYRAAVLANREQLSLYYGIGKYISENSRQHFWGTSAIDTISRKLQQELLGLRGFSPVNIKRMRQFYEAWQHQFEDTSNELFINRPSSTDEIQIDVLLEYRSLSMGDSKMEHFLGIGFTHHYELLIKTTTIAERQFYIERCATEFWNVNNLKHHLKSNLYTKRTKLPNNFNTTISDTDLRRKALLTFKDECWKTKS